MKDRIYIKGAKENNLKNIDVEIPRNKLVVFTGVSGSGKSTLAFDTIFAEGQRRYVESLSSYARQFLGQMQKPNVELYNEFVNKYKKLNKEFGKDQYLVPYLMSSHPGSTLNDAIKLAEYLHKENLNVEQVQDFYPTPSTLSTCMYYTGVDPRTMETVYVATSKEEKAMQRALIQYRNPRNYHLVKKALIKAKRLDLIGYAKHCLIKPKSEQ